MLNGVDVVTAVVSESQTGLSNANVTGRLSVADAKESYINADSHS